MSNRINQNKTRKILDKSVMVKGLYGSIFRDSKCGLEKRRKRMLKKLKKNEKANI